MTNPLTARKEYGFASEVKPKKKLGTRRELRDQLVWSLHLTPSCPNSKWLKQLGNVELVPEYPIVCLLPYHPSSLTPLPSPPLPLPSHTLPLFIEKSRSKV